MTAQKVLKHAQVKKARTELKRLDGKMLMSIEDKGAGFEPGQLRSAGGGSGGFGLFGLRELLSLPGGRMEIEGKPGRGSRFRLLVPLSPEKTEMNHASITERAETGRATLAEAESGKTDAGAKIRIMLVDDHEAVRQGVANLIRREPDFEIAGQASDGEAAVRLADEIRPDVVLMDINMPVMDGIQATRLIHEKFAGVRIIGFSIHEEEAQKRAVMEAGAVAHFSKRGSSKDLIHAIRNCM